MLCEPRDPCVWPNLRVSASPRLAVTSAISVPPLPRLRHDVDERRLTAFDDVKGSSNSRREIIGVRDRALRVDAHPLRDLREVDVRILDRRPDVSARDAAIVPVGHALQVHDFLVIRAVVVHHRQDGDPVVCRRPQHSWRIHQVAVALDRQADHRLRLAAFEALQDMPGDVRTRVGQALRDDPAGALRTGARAADRDAAEAEAAWTDALEGRLPDDPRGLRDTLATRGATAPLNTLQKMIDQVRRKGDDVPRAQREGWLMLRGSLHQVLALRGSRVALYDLRESLEQHTGTLPVSFLAALHVLGDQSCLEALAAAYARAGSTDVRWRHQLASAFRAIQRREKLTARHAAIKRLGVRWPDAAVLWSGDKSR